MANTYTVNFNLPKPDKGDFDWDDEYHEAMDIIDEQLKLIYDEHISNLNNPHNTSFIKLTDTPSSYSGLANRVVVVNSTATGITTVTRVPAAEDSNKVGGLYPGNSANNVLKLDSTGKVPLNNIPSSLMTKSIYDTNNDGIVDKAETIDNGTYSATAQDIKNIADNLNKTLYIIEKVQPETAYTLTLDDDHKLISCNNANPITITVPTNTSVAFPVGTQILILQKGAGKVTITGASGVTINSADDVTTTVSQYSVAGLIKMATDTWLLFGDLEA